MYRVTAAILLGFFSMAVQAEGRFIGVGVGSVSYPNWVNEANSYAISAGFSSANTKQNAGSFGFEIFSGRWFSDNLGYEVGYANLGSVTGNQTLTGPSATYTYKYSASAFHICALAGIMQGNYKLFGKLGIFNASTKLTENGSVPSLNYTYNASFSESSSGLIVGAGYTHSITEKLISKLEFDVYNGVKFANNLTPTKTVDSKNMMKLTIGLVYQY